MVSVHAKGNYTYLLYYIRDSSTAYDDLRLIILQIYVFNYLTLTSACVTPFMDIVTIED